MTSKQQVTAPDWAKNVLYAAAIYNLVWGAAVIAAPMALFRWAGMEEPLYPQFWQCVGMIVGVYGVGYWLAARDPFRHWPIVLVGLLGKVFGPIGFLNAAWTGSLPWKWGATIVTNDLIWWVPFASILYLAFRHNTNASLGASSVSLDEAVRKIRSQRDASLFELSSASPTLVVFLRHTGCTFRRETLAELEKHRAEIEQSGVNLAIVHMGSPMDGTMMSQKHGLHHAHRFSDPDCLLYRAFGLRRGRFNQLFSLEVVGRGLRAMLRGHGIGKLNGDGFRMPGAFVLIDGKVVVEHRATSAADRPDYLSLLATAGSRVRRSTEMPRRPSELSGLALGRS